jgi:hypothetical protein
MAQDFERITAVWARFILRGRRTRGTGVCSLRDESRGMLFWRNRLVAATAATGTCAIAPQSTGISQKVMLRTAAQSCGGRRPSRVTIGERQ